VLHKRARINAPVTSPSLINGLVMDRYCCTLLGSRADDEAYAHEDGKKDDNS
jgi:hypothetical protein